VVQHFFNVRMTDNFIAGENQHKLEVGSVMLDFVNNSLDHFKFVKQLNRFPMIIKQHARCVSELNYKNILRDARLKITLQ
jgi:hypothetical protein